MVAPVYTNFVPPAIDAGNLNEVNTVIYDLLGDGTNPPTNDSDIRTNIGLGTMATQNATAVAITGGTADGVAITGGSVSALATDLAIADGGTGASTAAAARTNLGVPQIGPAFSANLTATQAYASGVVAVLLYQTEDFDTDNYYNPATGRFTPLVAGYYSIEAAAVADSNGGTLTGARLSIFKNAAEYQRGTQVTSSMTSFTTTAAGLVFMNGTTDFVDIRLNITGAGTVQALAISATRFSGHFVRP